MKWNGIDSEIVANKRRQARQGKEWEWKTSATTENASTQWKDHHIRSSHMSGDEMSWVIFAVVGK